MTSGLAPTLLHLGSLRGRASRREFAWVFLGSLALTALTLAVYLAPVGDVVRLVIVVFNWVLVYVGVAVCVRRLHDLGKTGWYLLFWVVPMMGVVLLAWFFARPSAKA